MGSSGAAVPSSIAGAISAAVAAEKAADDTEDSSTYLPLAGSNFGTKRVTQQMNAGITTDAAVVADWGSRMVLRLPVATTRWRLRYANYNTLLSLALTTPMTVNGLWVGSPAFGAARWNGNFTAAPTQVLAGFSVPVDGTDYVSPWIDDPAQQFAPGVDKLLSWGTAITATGTGYTRGGATQATLVGANGSATSANVSSGGVSITKAHVLGDVRMEYEFVGANPVGLFIGDSITDGNGDGDLTSGQNGTLPHETWPGAGALKNGFCAINLGISSANSSGTFSALSKWSFTRADLATTVPDFAVIALGANDLGSTAATIQGWQATVIANVKSLGIKRIYLATVTPRYGPANQGSITAGIGIGVTSISSTYSPGNVPILLGAGPTQEKVTVSAISGTGPYTLTVGATTKAHAAGDQIVHGNEINRQDLNEWMRSVPLGITGVIDMDAVMALSRGSASPDPRMMSLDLLHPLRSGYQLMAQVLNFRL
jgi:lysophospholipase L1-like esterase